MYLTMKSNNNKTEKQKKNEKRTVLKSVDAVIEKDSLEVCGCCHPESTRPGCM